MAAGRDPSLTYSIAYRSSKQSTKQQSDDCITPPPCSFVAFGGGPRICIGMEFARIETLVTMRHLVSSGGARLEIWEGAKQVVLLKI
ncbi:hypothetical protein EJB05_12241, partial [Eragrostis curvula]